MTGGRFGATRGDVLRLFEGDSVAGLRDGELLERFASRRDEAAFEGLVTRLGPMVLGVCRRMLADPHDVDDAFQATFLVLVRKAASIRDPDLVAPWLHGVATRVARRARAESARRAVRERVAVVPEAREEADGLGSEWPELRALIDEEIERLPENHRRAVVLCDVEGLSREEAALRLGWSLNMVRGRLERARDRLRDRLARRGLAPSGAWAALLVSPPTPAPALHGLTIRAALAFSVGRVGTGLASASAVALSQGVLKMMMFSKLKIGLAVLLSTGFVAAGSGMLAAQAPGDKPAAKADVASSVSDIKAEQEALLARLGLVVLGKSRIDKARKRYETQLAFYKEGRITIDRLLNASQTLLDAELDATDAPEARRALVKAHLDRIKEIEKHELAEQEVGRATAADVEEVQTYRLEVEYRLAKEAEKASRKPSMVPPPADAKPAESKGVSNLAAERVEIARRLFDEAKRLFPAEIDLEDFVNAWKTLLEAEEGAARTKAERVKAAQGQIDVLKRLVPAFEQLVKDGLKKHSDLDRLRLKILDAQVHLDELSRTPEGPGKGPAEGVAPKPTGPLPASGPGASKATDARTLSPSPLASAIEAFNANAARDEIGRDQPPLTEDEVVAAIRLYEFEETQKANFSTISSPGADEYFEEFRQIAETRRMPPGARFEVGRVINPGDGFFYYGWWVRIVLSEESGKRGRTYTFTIRSRLIRSTSLQEELKQAEDHVRLATPRDFRMEERVRELRALRARLERKKGERSDKKATTDQIGVKP